MARTSKDDYYLDIADAVRERATCLRRTYGAIIVNNDEIISSGYNGAPRGRCNCTDMGVCHREELRIPSGQRYELCRSVHAEQNAIIQAARNGTSVVGATLYCTHQPCVICAKIIINAGISRVVYKNGYPDEFSLQLFNEANVKVEKYEE